MLLVQRRVAPELELVQMLYKLWVGRSVTVPTIEAKGGTPLVLQLFLAAVQEETPSVPANKEEYTISAPMRREEEAPRTRTMIGI